MGDNLEKVFVAFASSSTWCIPILDWALNNFEPDEAKIFLSPYVEHDPLKSIFTSVATTHYLPRCSKKKFKAKILIPRVAGVTPSILELITKHGMRKLVISADGWNKNELSKWFDDRSDLSCKIWIVNGKNGKLDSTRDVVSEASPSAPLKDDERIKNMEELLRREKEENEELKSEIQKLKGKVESNEENQDLIEAFERIKEERDKFKEERDNAVKEAEILRKERNDMLIPHSEFTLQELEQATNNFSNSPIGEGGYGSVYKGHLRGMDVAIKMLKFQETGAVLAFKQELAILTTVRHPNLVTFMGTCYEASALICEFLPNGSLESHLNRQNNTTPLTWQIRTRIICEICLALIFLHSSTSNLVIHGDLKPDNVLLDANFVSKLCDFGISRLIKRPEAGATPSYSTKNPLETPGYMDPEYVTSGRLTEKSDVYSFGVIILRVITGKPVTSIASEVKEAMRAMTFHEMIDVSAGEWPFDEAKELAVLGLRYTKMYRKNRPDLFNEIWPIVNRLRRNL
ncbi:hypothetical protein LUZ60_001839 [Juncus effusus]|nr:hypothetical protein LUZ60_001839 [Juncus effusus]